ncbi:hypothetical protein JL39_06390 [Rhizobium sp. YS-1r]|jgi:hypothetical protein|nr:hypothetical protein JL39_06390 [Rhizobium sp. YS-1r]
MSISNSAFIATSSGFHLKQDANHGRSDQDRKRISALLPLHIRRNLHLPPNGDVAMRQHLQEILAVTQPFLY